MQENFSRVVRVVFDPDAFENPPITYLERYQAEAAGFTHTASATPEDAERGDEYKWILGEDFPVFAKDDFSCDLELFLTREGEPGTAQDSLIMHLRNTDKPETPVYSFPPMLVFGIKQAAYELTGRRISNASKEFEDPRAFFNALTPDIVTEYIDREQARIFGHILSSALIFQDAFPEFLNAAIKVSSCSALEAGGKHTLQSFGFTIPEPTVTATVS